MVVVVVVGGGGLSTLTGAWARSGGAGLPVLSIPVATSPVASLTWDEPSN